MSDRQDYDVAAAYMFLAIDAANGVGCAQMCGTALFLWSNASPVDRKSFLRAALKSVSVEEKGHIHG